MLNLKKHLLRLSKDFSLSDVEISAASPFVKITLKRVEIDPLLRANQYTSNVVAKCFVRRRVFWEDLSKEHHEYVVKSLAAVTKELNDLSDKLLSEPNSSVALSNLIRDWATGTVLVHKELRERLGEIAEEKASTPGYDSANEDRATELSHTLVSLRQRIYPLVSVLIQLLDDDDPTKGEAQKLWDNGLNSTLDAKLIRGCIPDVDEAD